MSSSKWSFVCVAVIVLTIASVALVRFGYKGVADSETVKIIQAEWASPKRVAMLVERSDHAALSGNTYFVFVGERIYSVPELRKRLYGLPNVFKVGLGEGLSIGWSAPDELSITCSNCGITKEIIESQKFSEGNIRVRYVRFPDRMNPSPVS